MDKAKKLESYTLVGKLGEGQFGKVYRAINEKDGKVYAVKCVPKAVRKSLKS